MYSFLLAISAVAQSVQNSLKRSVKKSRSFRPARSEQFCEIHAQSCAVCVCVCLFVVNLPHVADCYSIIPDRGPSATDNSCCFESIYWRYCYFCNSFILFISGLWSLLMLFSYIVVLMVLVLLLISPQYFILISEVIDDFDEKHLFCI